MYFKKKPPIFKAKYTFLHPAVCGPTVIKARKPGYMRFPDLTVSKFDDVDVYCIWDIIVLKDADLHLTFANITMKSESCAQHSVSISSSENKEYHKECGQTKHQKKILVPGRENNGVLKLGVRMKSLNLGKFDLSWKY